MDPIRERIIRLFQYLLETRSLNDTIIRKVDDYETVWWQFDLEQMHGIEITEPYVDDHVWLTIQRPVIPAPPSPPTEIRPLITKWNDPEEEPIPQSLEAFSEQEEQALKYNDWFHQQWRPWAEDVRERWQVKKIYDRLFLLYNQLHDEGSGIEIAWGHGLLTWSVDDIQINRHLIVTPLELQFDAEKGEFRLNVTSQGSIMETDMFSNTSFLQLNQLHALFDKQLTEELQPRQESELSALLRKMVHIISPDGQYSSSFRPVQDQLDTPHITYSPALLIRKTSGRIWGHELHDVIHKVENNFPISSNLARLVSIEQNELDNYLSYQEDWSAITDNLLFPLPANEQQQEIVKRLAEEDGVVVQGPPGTGKTHTIANLICHLLAHGKRVLIASEKERALAVLRDKIPAEIRPLCVSILGGDSKSMKELEYAIRTIAENLESRKVDSLKSNIQYYRQELEAANQRMTEIENRINRAAIHENEEKEIGGTTYTPLTAAQWLKENQRYGWLPDNISPNTPFPLKKEELKSFITWVQQTSQEDRAALNQIRPNCSDLPEPDVFRGLMTDLEQISQRVQKSQYLIRDWNQSQSLTPLLPTVLRMVHQIIHELQGYSDTWRMTVLKEGLEENTWKELVTEFREKLAWLIAMDKKLLEYHVIIPYNQPEATIQQDIHYVLERMENSKGTGSLFRRLTGRKYSYLFRQCLINGKPIESKEDFLLVSDYIERNLVRNRMLLKWNRIMESIHGPLFEAETPRLTTLFEECLDQIDHLLNWPERVIQPLGEFTQKLGVVKADWIDAHWYEEFAEGLEALQDYLKWERRNQRYRDLVEMLEDGSRLSHSHETWQSLLTVCQTANVEKYEEIYTLLERLQEMELDYAQFEQFYMQLESVCPQWLEQLLTQQNVYPSEEIEKAWVWSQINTWLQIELGAGDLDELEMEWRKEQEKKAHLIKQLVADSTWKERIEQTTEMQKRSLIAWLQLIKKIGTSTGPIIDRYKKEANHELSNCRSAIPVWIMPIQRVIENFPLDKELFDVVIVDESSQSNLYALTSLLRAKKVVVVGDDCQISPESDGIDTSMNHELIQRYLYDIPQSGHFEVTTSLYDTATRIIHNKVILKEHFRSVPDIIQYCNRTMYGGEIIPLRLPMEHERFDEPVQAVRVASNFQSSNEGLSTSINNAEARQIVDKVAQISQDPAYDGKTVGIISLNGYEQALHIEEMLREEIGEAEMSKRRLICGNPYRFQGDERDVILLSLADESKGDLKPWTSESDRRFINVAVSRARDQLILFHSFDIQDLKPSCARYSLLQYCLNPAQYQVEDSEKTLAFETELERDVYERIVSRGYRVSTQVQAALGKRIDIVIEGEKSRLAVECDGDKWRNLDQWRSEIEKQRILERVGWRFCRIRGSVFYRSPDQAMEPLWQQLDELKIYPQLETHI